MGVSSEANEKYLNERVGGKYFFIIKKLKSEKIKNLIGFFHFADSL